MDKMSGGIETLHSEPWEDIQLISFARMQIGAAPPYSPWAFKCQTWAEEMIKIGYGAAEIKCCGDGSQTRVGMDWTPPPSPPVPSAPYNWNDFPYQLMN
jgi:hypothetical protein